MITTSNVLDHHLKCFAESDLAGMMTDYSSNAVLFMPSGSFKGSEEIKSALETLLMEFAKPGCSFSLQWRSAEGHYAYIGWSAETPDNSYENATDTFIVQNEKIVTQCFEAKITPKR
jgi:ketosteroid isomerase-like protein